MADSNITKQAMATAFKELLQEQPFEKISVSDICDRCHMNRKSFYYHFRDKFDLANWIFDTEFMEVTRNNDIDVEADTVNIEDRWNDLKIVCEYFYENRTFYYRLLQVDGQNSFPEHFRGFIHPILRKRMPLIIGERELPPMVYDFIVDGGAGPYERWMLVKNCATAEEFLDSIKGVMQVLVIGLSKRIKNNPEWFRGLYETN